MDKFKENLKTHLTEMAEIFIDLIVEGVRQETLQNLAQDNSTEPPDKNLTFNEVCAHFQISPTTLERRIREGLKYSQAVKKGNRLFKLNDCNKFFNIKS